MHKAPLISAARCNHASLTLQGLLREALHCFTVATRSVGPSRAIAHSCLGATLVELGRIQSAAKALREAINIDPLCMEAYINLGNGEQVKN